MTQLIGIQGGKASYHEQAAISLHQGSRLAYFDTFAALFGALRDGSVDTIVCAVYNTLIGDITESKAELAALEGRYQELGSIVLPIHHSLLVIKGTRLEDVQYVYSQQPALDQCRQFLADKLSAATPVPWKDTALSAKYVAETGNRANAAIASPAAGKLYNLVPLRTGVQDNNNNATKFIEITLIDKTSAEI